MQLPPNKPQNSIMKELKNNLNLNADGGKKDIGTKVIASIEDIPSGWKLVSETHNKKDKFYLDENLLKQGAIIYVDTSEEGKTVQKFYWFIGTQQFTLNGRLVKLMEELINNGERVFRSTVKDQRLIEELYKTSKDIIGSTDKDYSKSEKGSASKEVNDLFLRAITEGVSDIHLEVRKGFTRIRARINGHISNFYKTTFSEGTGRTYANVIYQTMAAVSSVTFQENTQQDALVTGIFGNEERKVKLRVRVASSPTEPNGFDMTMRLLVIQDSKKPLELETLGYNKKLTFNIIQAISQPVGLTIIAGTTGSGKSTTLQNLLMKKINERNGEIKVITIENPPEYFIPGASQWPVMQDKEGSALKGFQSAMRAAMRSDPDVLMIGEIRDNESANLTVQAVQSGHQVLSTVHASSALGVINRLENLGVGRDILGSPDFLAGLIYQKLLPKLCPHCSIPLENGRVPNKYSLEKIIEDNQYMSETELERWKKNNKHNTNFVRFLQDNKVFNSNTAEEILEIYRQKNSEEEKEHFLKRINEYYGGLSGANIRFRGPGCGKCRDGIAGRTVVAEVVRPDLKIIDLINDKRDSELLLYWRKNTGGRFAIEDACDKAKNGLVSLIDVENELGLIGSKLV
jgi:type II secretory ATPase GspE/PulE/Tfp pilus assembly ATPase PilB-like protein